MLIALAITCGIIGVFGFLFLTNADNIAEILFSIVLMCFFFGTYVFATADGRVKEQDFQKVIITKQYNTIIAGIQGVYNDKIVANDKQYKLDLNYSEIKSLADIKLNEAVKITYAHHKNKGEYIINIEKIK